MLNKHATRSQHTAQVSSSLKTFAGRAGSTSDWPSAVDGGQYAAESSGQPASAEQPR
jgi:hypothetical protein